MARSAGSTNSARPAARIDRRPLIVRNSLRHHTLRVDATPPADWGDRFTLQGRFTQRLLGRSGDWKHWSGSAYASLPRADVRELKRHVDLPFDLSEGNGALRAWVELQDGEPRIATVDVALREVALRLVRDASRSSSSRWRAASRRSATPKAGRSRCAASAS
jgi:uncharacterized protein YhdP